MAITALHHVEAEMDEADGATTQIVAFPAAFGDGSCTEQDGRDLAIAHIIGAGIERAQSEDELVPAKPR